MKKIVAVAVSILCAALLLSVLPIHGEDAIYTGVIRLHVLANSDTEEDQAVKLSVRDAVLAEAEKQLSNAKTREEAENAMDCTAIQKVAAACLRDAGRTESVSVQFGEEWYPTRVYEEFTLPAGTYASLRVEIGEAVGKNWWCILFPTVCGRFASHTADVSPETEYIAAGFTPEEYRLITENEHMPYKVRFWLLEQISKLFSDRSRT